MVKDDTSDEKPGECIHTHPLPPEQIARYSPTRDPDSETDIARYVEVEAQDETVKHVEKVKTEYVLGDPYEVWDVTTDKDRWWVLTNMTNLYSQKHFPSLDYTLSSHVGLMMRLRSRPQGPDADNPTPFDEVFRRAEQAEERLERAMEVEDFQAVGMLLREALISLIGAMRRELDLAEGVDRPKEADFINWSAVLFNELCRGPSNKELRSYLKVTSEKTWQLVNWLTHARSADGEASSIALGATRAAITQFFGILRRSKQTEKATCPVCASQNMRSHFDAALPPEGEYYSTCGNCGWSSHPEIIKSLQ
jgi:hypothetical protein